MRRLTLAVGLLIAGSARAQSSADDHMLLGARHFQTAQYSRALVEFRVAERMGDGAATWYAAATLVKLRRPQDALADFGRAADRAPSERDALFDYYHALACYDARLYFCADRLLAGLRERAGPRIAEHAEKVRGDLRPIISAPPAVVALDWYHTRGRAALGAGQSSLAALYYEEAASLAALRADHYRRAEALAGLVAARHSSGGTASSP